MIREEQLKNLERNNLLEHSDTSSYEEAVWLIPLTLSGDYCGHGSVGIANRRVLLESFSFLNVRKGSFDTEQVYLSDDKELIASIDEESWNDFISVISILGDYPLIDEEIHSEIEMELQDKAWELYVKDAFLDVLDKKHLWRDLLNEEDVRKLFYKACQEANEYWFEEIDGYCIHVDRIIPYVNRSELAFCVKTARKKKFLTVSELS